MKYGLSQRFVAPMSTLTFLKCLIYMLSALLSISVIKTYETVNQVEIQGAGNMNSSKGYIFKG